MNRRSFLALPAAFAATPAEPSLIKPKALKPGDTVGLITPSTYVSDPDKLASAERLLRYFDLKMRMGANVRKKSGYLGGTVEERVSDLHDMFRDPEVKAIFCVRGGYGSAQLLDKLDFKLIQANPKILLGYSDITALHLAIHKKTGLITFHGPVAVSGFTEYTQKHFRKVLFETTAPGAASNPPDPNLLRPRHPLRVVRPGKAQGRLIGGNLSLVASTMGTPYEIETRGRLLFLEDVGEEPYSIDRMLTQLRLGGKFDGITGLIWGECQGCRPRQFEQSFESTFSLGEVVDEILGKLKVPVLGGLTIGHTDDQLTLPIGAMATLDADNGEIIIEESGVS